MVRVSYWVPFSELLEPDWLMSWLLLTISSDCLSTLFSTLVTNTSCFSDEFDDRDRQWSCLSVLSATFELSPSSSELPIKDKFSKEEEEACSFLQTEIVFEEYFWFVKLFVARLMWWLLLFDFNFEPDTTDTFPGNIIFCKGGREDFNRNFSFIKWSPVPLQVDTVIHYQNFLLLNENDHCCAVRMEKDILKSKYETLPNS